jgi:hypothetical protein
MLLVPRWRGKLIAKKVYAMGVDLSESNLVHPLFEYSPNCTSDPRQQGTMNTMIFIKKSHPDDIGMAF